MPFQIRHDGKTFTVHTEVGNGLTRVVFTEDPQPAQTDTLSDRAQPQGESE